MDVQRYLDRIRDDEGVTADLNDDEAAILFEWLERTLPARLAQVTTEAEAEAITAAARTHLRRVAKATALLCHDRDAAGADQAWRKGNPSVASIASLQGKAAHEIMGLLLSREVTRA